MHKNPMIAAFDLVVLLAMMFMILALTSSTKPPHVQTYGKFVVIAQWPNYSNNDVDLYVRDPFGGIAYFGNLKVDQMHLEMDDLGTDISGVTFEPNGTTRISNPVNVERTVLTGIIPGQYTVNVQMYRRSDPSLNTPVRVQLWDLQGTDHVILEKTVMLHDSGSQVTIWRFNLSNSGSVSNVNSIPANLVQRNTY